MSYYTLHMSESKHVQTRLDRETYEALRTLAAERDLSIGSATHEAVSLWIDAQRRVSPEDPAFAVLDKPTETPSKTDMRIEDDLTDDWTGEDVEFRLVDDPKSTEE